MKRVLRLSAVPFALVALLVLEANGPTVTTVMAWSLPLLCVLFASTRPRPRLGLAVVGLGLAFIAARLAAAPATAAEVCVGTDCSNGRLWWQRVIDEREATRAGLYLSKHAGSMEGPEFAAFDALIDRSWRELPADWRGLPNPLLMASTPGHVATLRVRAHRTGQRPAIIFLHGFGGLLSLYVEALARGTHGAFDVIAPALDPVGAWWSDRGLAVLEATLATLPPDVDRVFLIGLSNGGVGATAVALRPALARRFAGIVLLSGIGPLEGLAAAPEPPVLVLSGTNDPRFPHRWVQAQVDTLEQLGADVTWKTFPADHFLLLTHAAEWTRAFTAWTTP